MTQCKTLYWFEECFSKNTKNNSEKQGKRVFWAIVGPSTQPKAITKKNISMEFLWQLACTPWEPHLAKKKLFLAGNFKVCSIMKVCTVLRDVLTKTPKIIRRKGEKGHFGPNFWANFEHFG